MAILVLLLAGPASRLHASACTMHGRRGGALARLVSQRKTLWGEGSLSTLCLSTLSKPTFPVDSASGAKLLQLWSVLLAAISTSRAG